MDNPNQDADLEKATNILRELKVKETELKQKETNLHIIEKKLKVREESVKDLEKIRDQLEANYRAKEKELRELENKVLNGKTKELLDKEGQIKELTKQLNQLKNSLEEADLRLVQKQADINVEISSYKAEQLKNVNHQVGELLKQELINTNAQTSNIFKTISENIHSSIASLNDGYTKMVDTYDEIAKAKVNQAEALRIELLKLIDEFEKKSSALNDIETRTKLLESREKLLIKKEGHFDLIVKDRVQVEYGELQATSQGYKDQIDRLSKMYQEVYATKEKLSQENLTLRETGVKSLEEQLFAARKRNAELEEKYKAYTSDVFAQIKAKATDYDRLLTLNEDLGKELTELKAENQRLKTDKSSMDSLIFINNGLKFEIGQRTTYLAKLEDELDSLKSRVEDSAKGVIASEAIETPYQAFLDLPVNDSTNLDEIKWLELIIRKCDASGYKFSRRLVYSFHTSLKINSISPLTVLAGISGTGKSKLPQLYSRFGGIFFLSLPVQPDWDSPQSLFGYFNSVEKRFNATSLLRAIVSFQKEANDNEKILDLSDRMLLVLLDEMNLAHVELYFADLLSKLEEQRGESKVQKFEIDLGASLPKYNVRLSRNILWTGTMNEDETTKTLSDKVIDRGSVLSFPRPEKFMPFIDRKLEDLTPMIHKNIWKKWVEAGSQLIHSPEMTAQLDAYRNVVMEINKLMRFANRALGHRVSQSIENYLISHPIVIQHADNANELKKALTYAFEEAVVHKIIPKLRGIQLEQEMLNHCLNPIRELLAIHANGLKHDFEAAINPNSATGTFIWDSAKYLEEDYTF